MWIYIDPPPRTATPGSASNSTASFIRDITPIHPTENDLRTTAARVGLLAWTPRRSRQHAVGSDLASSGPAGLAKFALHCLPQRSPPGVGGRKLQHLPERLGRWMPEVAPK